MIKIFSILLFTILTLNSCTYVGKHILDSPQFTIKNYNSFNLNNADEEKYSVYIQNTKCMINLFCKDLDKEIKESMKQSGVNIVNKIEDANLIIRLNVSTVTELDQTTATIVKDFIVLSDLGDTYITDRNNTPHLNDPLELKLKFENKHNNDTSQNSNYSKKVKNLTGGLVAGGGIGFLISSFNPLVLGALAGGTVGYFCYDMLDKINLLTIVQIDIQKKLKNITNKNMKSLKKIADNTVEELFISDKTLWNTLSSKTVVLVSGYSIFRNDIIFSIKEILLNLITDILPQNNIRQVQKIKNR